MFVTYQIDQIVVELVVHLLNTVVLTAMVAFCVLWRYRRNVLAGMGRDVGEALALPPAPPTLEVVPQPPRAGALGWERGVRRRITLALLASVTPPALILGWFELYAGQLPMTPAHLLMFACKYWVAAVPMAAVSLALPPRRTLALAATVLLAGALLTTLVSMLQRPFYGRLPSVDQLLNVINFLLGAAVELGPPLALIWLTGLRSIRGIAPIAFAGLLVFGLAPLAGSWANTRLAESASGSRLLLGLGFNASFLLLSLPVAVLAWWRLRRLAGAYAEKRFSDAQLLARSDWLILCAFVALELANTELRQNLSVFVACAGAYTLFRWLSTRLLARSGVDAGRPPPRTLLLLRVFGFQARTERLFARVGARWRLFGPVTMIAAPDVMAYTIDPGDFMGFVDGRLADSFVTSRTGLNARLAGLDFRPDPDGRYRVSEFCCRNDTWRATVVELMHRADVVLMDLRKLDASRGGCSFELQQLAARLSPERIVLAVDGDTDMAMVRAAMPELPRLVTLADDGEAAHETLFAAVLTAAGLEPGGTHDTV